MKFQIQIDFKNPLKSVYKTLSHINILHIFLLVLCLHFFIMSTPESGFIFDEAHYVPAARSTLNMVAANAEHTPLAKVFIAWSIQAFGDWWFAWRIPSVIFSSLSVVFVYLIAKQFVTKKYALIASAFMTFDVLFFINGSLAILDPPAIFFALVGTYFLIINRYALSGLSFAIAVLSKETSLLMMLGAVLYKSFMLIRNRQHSTQKFFQKFSGVQLKKWEPNFKGFRKLQAFALFAIIFVSVTFGGIYVYDSIYKPSKSAVSAVSATVFVDQNNSAITTSLSTKVSQDYITNPIDHILFAFNYYRGLTPTINPLPQDFRPAWTWSLPLENAWNPPVYFGVQVKVNEVSTQTVSYRSQSSYPITIFMIPTLLACLFVVIKKSSDTFPFLYLGWIAGTYLPWIFFSIFVQRMTFNYYFTYTTPMLAIGLPWFFTKLPLSTKFRDVLLIGTLIIATIYFMYYFPLNIFR